MAATLKGWRYGVLWASFLTIIGSHVYVNMIKPMMDPEPYKHMRENLLKREKKEPTKTELVNQSTTAPE